MTTFDKKQKYPLYQRDCSACGAPLAFLSTYDGKKIPLDLRTPVYGVIPSTHWPERLEAVRTSMHYVSHFATCPKASEFSKHKPKEESDGKSPQSE